MEYGVLKDLSASELMQSFSGFVSEGCGSVLNQQQLEDAAVILESVCHESGLVLTLDLPHKDHLTLQNHLLAYLLRMYNHSENSLLVIHPDPGKQVGAMDQLVEYLWTNIFTRNRWSRQGDDFVIGRCRARFYHTDETLMPGAATRSLLVLINHVHDISIGILDTQVSRLISAGNPTRVVFGIDRLSVVENKNLAM